MSPQPFKVNFPVATMSPQPPQQIVSDYMGVEFPSPPTPHQRIDLVKQMYPDLWNQVHTKTIVEPHTHPPNSILSLMLCEGWINLHSGHPCNEGALASRMMEYDFPTYYVSQRIFDAIRHTHPPANQTWEHISFPFPAIAFMLPRGALKHVKDGRDVTFIAIAKIAGPYGERVCVFYPYCDSGVSDSCAIPLTELLEPTVGWMQANTSKGVPVDSDMSAYCFALAANLLCVMNNRRELIQLGEKLTSKKPPKPGRKPQHSPTWLGLHYQIRYEAGIDPDMPSSRFTEIGWRCGHFKEQRFGKGRKDSKTIWIEPYMAHTRGLQAIA
jgi:hypothetical protein